MKILVYIIMVIMFISIVGLGYVDYKHFSNDYKLELKIQKANNKNRILIHKIDGFCYQFNKKGGAKK